MYMQMHMALAGNLELNGVFNFLKINYLSSYYQLMLRDNGSVFKLSHNYISVVFYSITTKCSIISVVYFSIASKSVTR